MSRYPRASLHHVRVEFDLTRVDRGRHLLAKLREGAGSSGTADDPTWPVGLHWILLVWPKWIVTAHQAGHGIEWMRVDASGPPRVVESGDLSAVLAELPPHTSVHFLRSGGSPSGLAQQVVEECEGRPDWSAVVLVADTDLWQFEDPEIDEEVLVRLYPNNLVESTRGPLRITGRVLPPDE